MQRRQFIQTIAATVPCLHGPSAWGFQQQPDDYQRANTDWLAKCRYGIAVHWTAQTVPRHAGAEYILFTATHEWL